MAAPVEVKILGQAFSVTSDDGEEHIRDVAAYVDEKMREIAERGRAAPYTTAVMAALNIASECHKLRESQVAIEAAVERLTRRLDGGLGVEGEEISERV